MVNYTAIPHTNITTAQECGRSEQLEQEATRERSRSQVP